MDKYRRKELLGYGNQAKAAKRARISQPDMSYLLNEKQPKIGADKLARAKRVVAEMIHERHPEIAVEDVWAEAEQAAVVG